MFLDERIQRFGVSRPLDQFAVHFGYAPRLARLGVLHDQPAGQFEDAEVRVDGAEAVARGTRDLQTRSATTDRHR